MERAKFHNKLKKTTFLAGVSFAAAIGGSSAALAQQAGGAAQADAGSDSDIIVTATKRASTVQDVPFSINAQTEEDIQRSGATTIEDLSRNVAGLSVQNLGPGQSQVSVRGVSAGQIVRDQPGVKEQVGVYLDESVISLSLFTPDLDLFDLNRVETLRGPQGTLFGSGSVGGTIRYITNQPDLDRIEGTVEGNINKLDGGSWGGHLKGAVNIPLTPAAAIRFVGYHTEYGGFIDALREGGAIDKNVNKGTRTGGRIAMLLQPWADVRITPRVVYQEIRVDGFNRQEVFNLFANPLTTTRPRVTFDERQQFLLLNEDFVDETLIADLTASVGLGAIELTSVTSYIDRSILVSRDASALSGSVTINPFGALFGVPNSAALLPSNLRDTTELETFTQELRLSSTGTGPFQWLIGAFYSDIERVYAQRLPTPGYGNVLDASALGPGASAAINAPYDRDSPFNSDIPYDIEQKAVFGEASYEFGRLTATAGLRYYDFSEVRDIRFGGIFADATDRVGEETSSDGFSPRLILTYEAADDVTFNVQAAKGFRLGGVNDPLNLPLCTPEDRATFEPFEGAFGDETLWNYEAGVKSQFGGITFNAAAYYTDISDLQVTLDAGSCSSRIVFNVPEAHTMGLEVEFAASPVDGLDLSVSGSWIEAEFDSTLQGLEATTGIREGNRLPSVPNFQIAASAFYGFEIDTAGTELFFGATFQHVGSRYTQPSDQENNPRTFVHDLAPFIPAGSATTIDLKLPSYDLVNVSAGLEWDNGLGVTAYVNNVFDENPILAFDRERGGRARLGFHVGQPRTYGLTVRKRF
ncbi:MAG TPA: TonB-dependent receptor [Allosphingosinicella sp.]|jgi:iron complex outermembrane receptor protein